VSEHEVDLIVARLREELSASPDAGADGNGGGFQWAARAQAERFWPVTTDRPLLYKPGTWGRIRGTLLAPAKLALRKLMRWYVEPAFAQQRDFNASVLKALDQLNERVDEVLSELSSEVARGQERTVETSSAIAQTSSAVAELNRSAT
jgi:hypothetical protein